MLIAAQPIGTFARRFAFALVLLAVSTSLSACNGNDSDDHHSAATVMVDMFSGRPNPVFTLSPEATRQLEELLAALVTADVELPTFDHLGFRRFVVSNAHYDGSTSRISVTPDIIALDSTITALKDPEGSVFSFLRSEAKKELPPTESGVIPQLD